MDKLALKFPPRPATTERAFLIPMWESPYRP
jgi:hypothetical protein